MAYRYWSMMTDKKFALIYLGLHYHKNVQIAVKTVQFNDIKKNIIATLIKAKQTKILYYLISLRK